MGDIENKIAFGTDINNKEILNHVTGRILNIVGIDDESDSTIVLMLIDIAEDIAKSDDSEIALREFEERYNELDQSKELSERVKEAAGV